MFGIGGKQKKLDLTLPAVEQPILGASPSERIMGISTRRSVAYGLLFSAVLSVGFNILFAVLMISRIEMIPYVADGSSYGCSPKVVGMAATAPIYQETPQQSGLRELVPLNVDIEGDK